MKRLISVMLLLAGAAALTVWTVKAAEPSAPLTKTQLQFLTRTAHTSADHLKLAGYYRDEARKLAEEGKTHEEMGLDYDNNRIAHPVPKWPTLGEHCRALAKNYHAAAMTAIDLAAMHEDMARGAK